MNDAVLQPVDALAPIPLRELMPWIVFGGLLMLLVLYFVGAEEGATSLVRCIARFVHDGRHLLSFPATDKETIMVGKLLMRGMLAGVVARLIAFGFARVAGEPQVRSRDRLRGAHARHGRRRARGPNW